MGEKGKKEKVTSISKKQKKEVLNIEGLTAEDIAEQMRKDEEEIENRLSKFASFMPSADSSSVTEEDEDDEDFVVDLGTGIVTQVEETLLVREGEGMMIKMDAGMPYADFIRDLFVRKAIAKLLKETRMQLDETIMQQEKMPGYLADTLTPVVTEIEKKRNVLSACIRGNKVYYDEIPEWAKIHVEEYIDRVLTNLILLGED